MGIIKSITDNKKFIIIILICIGIGIILGLSIINTINARLGQISINMPKIHISKHNVTDTYQENFSDLNLNLYNPEHVHPASLSLPLSVSNVNDGSVNGTNISKSYISESQPAPTPRAETYYKNPSDMTEAQLFKFKTKAKMSKMTVQDYLNWLNLFKSDPEHLPTVHYTNYLKMLNNQILTQQDIPQVDTNIPLTSQDYYDNLMISALSG